MDNDSKTQIISIALAVLGVLGVAAIFVVAGNYSTYAISKMVQAGANPLDAKCSLSYADPVCILLAAGKKP